MLAVAPDAAEALFRVVDAAYEKRSFALTATSTTDGTDSYRLAQTTAGKGVRPPHLTRAARWGDPMATSGERTCAASGEVRWPPLGETDGR